MECECSYLQDVEVSFDMRMHVHAESRGGSGHVSSESGSGHFRAGASGEQSGQWVWECRCMQRAEDPCGHVITDMFNEPIGIGIVSAGYVVSHLGSGCFRSGSPREQRWAVSL